MELKIYGKDGNLKLTASPGSSSTLAEEVMGECSVSASFTHTAFVPLDVNDYTEVLGVKYKIRSPYRPAQKNTHTYQYQVKLYAPIHDAEDALMLYTADGDIRSEFSYDGGPREHLQLWVDNMNRIAGSALWSIGTVITGGNKTIDYNNLSCWDAAFGSSGIAAAFETEMWADGFVINLCKASRGETVELGYLQGLTRLSQEDNGDVKFFTRLFPLGSTRNIDASKYGHARLQLPSGAAYVDKNTELYGVKEAYEEAAFAGIYPKYTGTISSVRTEEKENEEGRKYTVYYFKDSGMAFNPMDYQIPDLTFMLAFQTGDLAGRGNGEDGSFEAAWHEDTSEWEIINVYPDETAQIPGGSIVPNVGDTYIPWNFSLPQEYVTAAEQAYAEAVDDFLATYSFDTKKYNGTTDRNYIERNGTSIAIGQNVRLLSDEYFAAGYKDTRIVKCVRKLNDLSQATVTCTDQIGTGWKTSVDNQLSDLHYILTKQEQQTLIDIIKTGDNKTPSDYNVFSALKALAMFLRKDRPDTAQAVITFLKGLTAGDFQQGSSGVGIWQDDDGNWHIETDYLDVRMKFTAREVEIQRVYHIAGAQMKTSANMKCVRVEELDDVYRCYMNTTDDDGNEITNDFKLQDQAYVQTFNLVKQADGTTGNHFLWRLVVAVGNDYIDLSKSVCAQGSDAPKAGDDIVQLGYRGTDDPNRQNAVIDAGAGEGSPYYRQFTGINSFSFPEPETQLKPGDNIVTGRMKIQPGSTGSANLADLPDEVYKAVQIGGENLLLNTAFAGDYDSKKLDPATALQKDTQMYSPNMLHWTGNGTTAAEASAPAGFACRIGSISQPVSLISGENYVFSFYAKGNGVEMSCGGSNVSRQLSSSYQHYSMKFTYQSGGVFLLSGDATVHSLKLERGTIATDWCPSVLDPSSVADRFKGMWYLQQALKGSTQFIGGLGLTTMMQLGKWTDGVMEKVNAGISGIYNEDTDVAFWVGGTFEQAIATVRKIIGGENPSDEEWKSLAKFVATHGGDIFLRGYIYALGGVFRGTVYAENGEFSGIVKAQSLYIRPYFVLGGGFELDPVTMGNFIYGAFPMPTAGTENDPIILPQSDSWEGLVIHVSTLIMTRSQIDIRLDAGTNRFSGIQGGEDEYRYMQCPSGNVFTLTLIGGKWLVSPSLSAMYSNDIESDVWDDYLTIEENSKAGLTTTVTVRTGDTTQSTLGFEKGLLRSVVNSAIQAN